MQLPKTMPRCAGPKCSLRTSVCTNEGLSVTESWHRYERDEGREVEASAVCTVQTFGRMGKVWSSA